MRAECHSFNLAGKRKFRNRVDGDMVLRSITDKKKTPRSTTCGDGRRLSERFRRPSGGDAGGQHAAYKCPTICTSNHDAFDGSRVFHERSSAPLHHC